MKPLLTLALMPLLSIAPLSLSASEAPASAFTYLGKVAPISESRGSMLVEDSKGDPLLLVLLRDMIEGKGPRTSLLITHLPSGKTEQVFFPDEKASNANNYCLFTSSKKRFYLSTDKHFFEYDLDSRKILYSKNGMTGPAMSMDEDADGNIYFAIYPSSELYRYTPEKQDLAKVTRLDPKQQYPSSMAICEEGWVYTGIGTVQPLLIAWNPKTGERISLGAADAKGPGAGKVIVTLDGKVYGKVLVNDPFTRIKGGRFVPDDRLATISPEATGASLYWLQQRHTLPNGTALTHLSLRERTLRWKPTDGEEKSISFDYATEGADISCIVKAANGKLYGNTSHPMELWEYDPAASKIAQLGHDPRIGGGNITKLLAWKDGITGNSYSKGDLYFYTPGQPFQPRAGAGENPALLANSAPWVSRPRALLLHPDGEHLLSAGYPGYGRIGSGLLIYNLAQRQTVAMLPPDELLPEQGISSMASSPDGSVIYLAGTARTPGGATEKAEECELAAFSWKERKLLWKMTPVETSRQLTAIHLIDEDHLAGITTEGTFFVVNLSEQKTVHEQKLEGHSPAESRGDTSFVHLPGGKDSLLLMHRAIFKLNHATRTLEQVTDTPVSILNVGPIANDSLYFGSAGSLWKYDLPASLRQAQ